MSRVKIDTDIAMEHKNRFLRFTPTISTGHIVTAVTIVIASTMAWAQMRSDVNMALQNINQLALENKARIEETKAVIAKLDEDRAELYKKMSENHLEMQGEIKQSQNDTHEELKEMNLALALRFDRIEDKIDKKVDKK